MARTRVASFLLMLWVGSSEVYAEKTPFMVPKHFDSLQERAEEHEDHDQRLEMTKAVSLLLRSRENNSISAPGINPPKSSSEELSSFLVVPLANLTWLSDGMAANGSHVFVSVAEHMEAFLVEEPVDALYPDWPCRNPPGPRSQVGRCMPLVRCALQEVVEEYSTFLLHFCPIGRHAGVCCPRLVARSVQWALAVQERMAAHYRNLAPPEDFS